MANGACSNRALFTAAEGESVSGTGVIGNVVSVESNADDIGLLVVLSGSVAALTIELEHFLGNTWAQVGSVQTTITSGEALVFAGVPSTGKYRINATTVTTPSSLSVSAALVYSKKYD